MRDVFHNVKALELIKAATGPTSSDDGGLAVDTRPYNGKAMAVLNVVVESGEGTSDIVTVTLHEIAAYSATVGDLDDDNKIATFTAVAGLVAATEVDEYEQISVDLDAMSERYIEAKITVADSAAYIIACSLLCDQAGVNPVN